MRAHEMRANSYAWRLEVPVWNAKHFLDIVAMEYKPRLLLITRPTSNDEYLRPCFIIGFVELDIGGRFEGKSKWFAYHYPNSGDELSTHYDETSTWMRTVLEEGEERHPRDTAEAAIEHLLKLVEDGIPRDEHRALTATAKFFLPPLKQMTDTFVRKAGQNTTKNIK